jgi:hypothetical protein
MAIHDKVPYIGKPTPKAHDVGVYLRRHNRILTFIGAFIVFATFVVKDGIREHLKDLTDSVAAAESVFLIRDENIETSRTLGNIQRQIAAITQTADNSPLYAAALDVEIVKLYMSNTEYFLDNIYRLISKLPDQKTPITFKNSWLSGTQRKNPWEFWRDLQNQLTQLKQSDSNVRQLMRPDHVGEEKAARAADKLFGDSVVLWIDTRAFGWLVLEEAVKMREKSEHSYEFFTNVTYVLYVFGWGLALSGRLYKVAGLGGE